VEWVRGLRELWYVMFCFVYFLNHMLSLGTRQPGRINVSKVMSIKARILEPRSAARLDLFPDSAATQSYITFGL
jgi:hypothetical protein